MLEHYDRRGKRISLLEWANLFGADMDDRRVALTEIGPYEVSTVWIGLDMNYLGEGEPLIFETMVFLASTWKARERNEKGRRIEPLHDLDCHRWSTEEKAREGHEEVCTLIRATLQEQPDFLPDHKTT